MHLTVWLHCLEELEGLVHVMALLVWTHWGATILQPSEGSDATAVYKQTIILEPIRKRSVCPACKLIGR